ncbi:MAG: SDR family oxidoreductase [Phycisphaeraceae bacterium]|nr:SDR family oxidoreductase [Phycisphaeraceae bacterium]
MLLKEKIAIVTGAAQGIGQGIAEVFSREGAMVIIADIQEAKGVEAAAQIQKKTGQPVTFRKLDVADEHAIGPFVSSVEEEFKRIDVLVNNAAVQDWVPFLETSLAMWDKHFAVNVRGMFLLSQAVAKIMVRQGGGKIINMSSDSGLAPLPEGATAYCATKSAIIALTRNIAKELGRHKVYCNAICPGAIMTPTTERFMQKTWEPNQNPEGWAQAAALRKVGYPEDIGRVALFLACYLSDHVTGEHLLVTGGDAMSQ